MQGQGTGTGLEGVLHRAMLEGKTNKTNTLLGSFRNTQKKKYQEGGWKVKFGRHGVALIDGHRRAIDVPVATLFVCLSSFVYWLAFVC